MAVASEISAQLSRCPCGANLAFLDCHGRDLPRPGVEPVAQPVVVVGSLPTLKLDLACGQSPREHFEGVDLHAPNAKHKWDLTSYPWPLADSSVLALHCSHYIEHIEMGYVSNDGTPVRPGHPEARDAFFRFFDECYRVLVDGGMMDVICPAASSDRAFQDPTHRRFIPCVTFNYLNRDWRQHEKLDHYRVDCHFEGGYAPIPHPELEMRHFQARERLMERERNWVRDWHARLVAKK